MATGARARSCRQALFVAAAGLVAGWAILPLVRRAVLDVAEHEGPSMEPTLREGDTVLVDRLAYGALAPWDGAPLSPVAAPRPGDVVVIDVGGSEGPIVKRVIGLPGDRIAIVADVVFRDGAPIERTAVSCDWARPGEICAEERLGDRRWRTLRAASSAPETFEESVVPEGRLFVLGDHRDASYDSRDPVRLGMVPIDSVRGRVVALLASPFEGRAPAALP